MWIRRITGKVSASIIPLTNPVVKDLSSVVLSRTRCLLARGLITTTTNFIVVTASAACSDNKCIPRAITF
jgi:hypothetical protein